MLHALFKYLSKIYELTSLDLHQNIIPHNILLESLLAVTVI